MKPEVQLAIARYSEPQSGDWLTSALGVLSESERELVLGTTDSAARVQRAVGRAVIRLLAAEASGENPRQLAVMVSAAGKPLLTDLPNLHVSVAHTTGLVVVALCWSTLIGVDVEPALSPAPSHLQLAERLFDASEVAALREVPDAEVPGWFSSVWTIKESVGKALGDGIVPALSGAVVQRKAEGFALASVWRGPSADSWTLHQLTAPDGSEKIAVALPAANVPLGSVSSVTLEGFANACSTGRTLSGLSSRTLEHAAVVPPSCFIASTNRIR